MKRMSWFGVMASVLLTAALTANFAFAASLSWDPGLTGGTSLGGSGTWNATLSNWYNSTGDTTWTSGADAAFDTAAGSVTLGSAITVHNMTFSVSGYTVSGNSTNNLTFTGTTPTLSVATGTAAIRGATLAGSSGLVKDGAGMLTWAPTATSSLTGGVTVNAGTLNLASIGVGAGDNGLGAFSAGMTYTVNNATLQLSSTNDYALNFKDSVVLNGGTLTSTSKNQRLANLTMTSGVCAVTSSAGSFWVGTGTTSAAGQNFSWTVDKSASGSIISGAISFGYTPEGYAGNAANLTVNVAEGTADADLTISGQISASGIYAASLNLLKTGDGTLVISNATNAYQGKTLIDAGVIRISAEQCLGVNPVKNSAGGTNASFIANQLTLDGGTLQTTATFTVDDTYRGITIGSSGGTFSTNAGTTLTLASTNVITGSGALTKAGTGELILAAANTYTGATYVNAGTLALASTGSLASSTVYVASAGNAAGTASFNGAQATFAKTLASGATYSLASTIAGDLGTHATITGTSAAAETVAMSWRTRTSDEMVKSASQLISDIVYIAPTTEGYSLSLTYDATAFSVANGYSLSCIAIAYYDGATWETLTSSVVDGVVTASISSDIATSGAAFAVVPEPRTLTMLVAAAFGLIAYAWRKRKNRFMISNL
jgi:autotransporter-associated beta strand protein